MARPRKKLTKEQLEQLEKLAGMGATNSEMGSFFDMSPDTLERRFAVPIKNGRETLKARLRIAQVNLALKGNASMLIWLGKQILGQSDRFDVNQQSEPTGFVFVNPSRS